MLANWLKVTPPLIFALIDLFDVDPEFRRSWSGKFFEPKSTQPGPDGLVISLWIAVIIMVIFDRPNSAPLPVHLLRRKAADLSRRIYASLPWGYRVAELMLVLAADSLEAFGRVMYAEMIKSVVRGMPDTATGKAAFDLIQDVTRKGADALPPAYGKPFAGRVYKILLTKFGDEEIAEEVMSKVMMQAVRGKLHIANGSDLHSAESYIITACLNAGRDLLRARGRRREEPLVRDRDEERGQVDVEDPSSFEALDKLLPASELREVLRQLSDVHPRAPEWLRAKLDGDSGQEIAAEWQTTPSYVSKWQRIYLPKIKRVVEHHLRSARTRNSYSYDFGT